MPFPNNLLDPYTMNTSNWDFLGTQGTITITTGQGPDPLGGSNAIKMDEGTSTNAHGGIQILSVGTFGVQKQHRLGIYAKAGSCTAFQLPFADVAGNYSAACFDLSGGTYTQGNSGLLPARVEMNAVGGGWYLCELWIVNYVNQYRIQPNMALSSTFNNSGNRGRQNYTGTNRYLYFYEAYLEEIPYRRNIFIGQ